MGKENFGKTKTDRKILNVCILALFISLILIVLYFVFFHNGFSIDSNSWSNFGDYFNGVLTPILTAVNIFVFIRLTTIISDIESKRAQQALIQEEKRSEKELKQAKEQLEKELEHDKIRLERELDNEKKMLLMQLRKQEIDSFVKVMDDILVFEKQYNIDELAYPILRAHKYSEYLSSTGVKIFGIERDPKLRGLIRHLNNNLDIMYNELIVKRKIDPDIHLKIYEEKMDILDSLIDITMGIMKE